MNRVSDAIYLWPTDREFALDVGVDVARVRLWRHRGSIPAEFWAAIEAAAERREIKGASASDLARLAASRQAASPTVEAGAEAA